MASLIKHQVSLQDLHTLKCPSEAEYWVSIDSYEQLNRVRAWWCNNPCPLQVMGQGSNVLCPPWVAGLTVHNALLGYEIEHEDTQSVHVRVASGTDWHQWVQFCADQAWHGLENLALIPGTVGASPVQNIGAYGVEVSRCIQSVRAFDWRSGTLREFSSEECQFDYRSSMFKQADQGLWFITDVVFKLSKIFEPLLTYAPLDRLDRLLLTPHQLIAEVTRVRQTKLPDPKTVPNVGSFFTNPIITQQQSAQLKRDHPRLPLYPIDNHRVKVSAAFLIDESGWKGWQDQHSGVGTWQHHALVIVNPHQQPLPEIMRVAEQIKIDIQQRFGVQLDIEPQLINRHSLRL